MNIMKLMFVGALLACLTNLIFIGLVKSGEQLAAVEVRVANQILPITSDNTLTAAEQDKTIVVRGQYVGKALPENQKIVLQINDQNIDAKLESEGIFTAAIPAQQLIQSPAHIISAVLMQDGQALQQTTHVYQ
ncbi:unnamed protein product, partial [Cylicostephanus goldi]